MGKQERWTFRLPSNGEGDSFLKQMRKYLNKNTYKLSKMYTGPRPNGTSPYATRKENASSVRIYIDSKLLPQPTLTTWEDMVQENNELRAKLAEAYGALRTIEKIVNSTEDSRENFARRYHR